MDIRDGPPKWLDWDGSRWSLQKDGYYKDKTGSLFHVVFWERANGRRLEQGEIVHHIDHDRQNNDISNLATMSRADHIRHHMEDRGFTFTDESRGLGAKAVWANRKPRDCVCEWCKVTYQSIGMRVRFCSPRCSQSHLRNVRREERAERRRIRPDD